MSSCAAPASAREALEMIRSGYGFLAAADPAAMATAAQASCLLALEQADAIGTATSRRADRPWRCYRPDHPAGNTASKPGSP